MVSNQTLSRGSGQPALSRALRGTALVLVLCGATACSLLQGSKPAPVQEAAPPPPAPVADTGPRTSVDAAIARGDTSSGPRETSADAGAAGPVLNPSAPKSYTVQRGDTLWGISSMFLRDPWLWPEIWQINPAVRNPHLIYPGDVLALAFGADGRPMLRLERGSAARVEPLVRSSPIDGPIATIPYSAIAAFLGRPSVLAREDVRKAPQVIALREDHMVGANGTEVYIRGLGTDAAGRYNIVRQGQELRDPDNGKVLGYMGLYTGAARIEKVDRISKAVVVDSSRETQAGDLLFSDDVQATSDFIPHAPASDIDGRIMAVVDGVLLIGQYQVVAINRGTTHGLEPGHVLAVDDAGDVVRTPCRRNWSDWCVGGNKVRLPDERAGTLLVFKTYERMSYGLIVSAVAPVRIADHVRNP
jgi:LysM repeat protein